MKNRLKGITLIETMLYLGLFTVIIIMVINFMLATQESTLNNNRRGNVYKSSEFIIQHINNSFENTLSIIDTNIASGILELQFTEGNKQYYISDTTLYFDTVPITPPNISITEFNLEPVYDGDPSPIAVHKIGRAHV